MNDPGALTGRTIGITRAEGQLGEARRLFEAAGGRRCSSGSAAAAPAWPTGPRA